MTSGIDTLVLLLFIATGTSGVALTRCRAGGGRAGEGERLAKRGGKGREGVDNREDAEKGQEREVRERGKCRGTKIKGEDGALPKLEGGRKKIRTGRKRRKRESRKKGM